MNWRMRLVPGGDEALALLYQLRAGGTQPLQTVALTVDPERWGEAGSLTAIVDLGEVTQLANELRSSALSGERIIRPGSVEELCLAIEHIEPEHIILDSSLPISRLADRWFPGHKSRLYWIDELASRLPDGMLPEDESQLDSMSALLLWAATLPSLASLTAVVPGGIAVDDRYVWVRGTVRKYLELAAALELPEGLFPAMTHLVPIVLYFGGTHDSSYIDRLPTIAELTEPERREWFQRLHLWLTEGEPYPPCMVPLGTDITWSRASTLDLAAERARLARLGPVEPLGSLAQVIQGMKILRSHPEVEGGIPVVRLGNLRDGAVDLENTQHVELSSVQDKYRLQPGDILLSSAINDRTTAVLNLSCEDAVIESGVIIIRVSDDRVSPDYVLEYLNSDPAQEIIWTLATTNSWLGNRRLGLTNLRRLPVPLLDAQLLVGLQDIAHTENALRHKADELHRQRQNLFAAPNADAFARDVADLKRRGNLFARGIERADSVEYQIANFYPFPLAYGYRSLAGNADVADHYREQLRVAENVLAFLGSVAAALIPPARREEIGLDVRRLWRGGISPGEWRELFVRSVASARGHTSSRLVHQLHELNMASSKGFGGDIAGLIRAKNDYKHDRGPTTREEMVEVGSLVQERLARCMERLAFFTDYPLRQFRLSNRLRHSGCRIEYVSYVGDHPALPTESETRTADAPALDLIEGDLYVVSDRDRWVSLYPFLSVHTCPHCRAREVFFIDKLDERSSTAILKSFERGHTEEKAEIGQELMAWTPGVVGAR